MTLNKILKKRNYNRLYDLKTTIDEMSSKLNVTQELLGVFFNYLADLKLLNNGVSGVESLDNDKLIAIRNKMISQLKKINASFDNFEEWSATLISIIGTKIIKGTTIPHKPNQRFKKRNKGNGLKITDTHIDKDLLKLQKMGKENVIKKIKTIVSVSKLVALVPLLRETAIVYNIPLKAHMKYLLDIKNDDEIMTETNFRRFLNMVYGKEQTNEAFRALNGDSNSVVENINEEGKLILSELILKPKYILSDYNRQNLIKYINKNQLIESLLKEPYSTRKDLHPSGFEYNALDIISILHSIVYENTKSIKQPLSFVALIDLGKKLSSTDFTDEKMEKYQKILISNIKFVYPIPPPFLNDFKNNRENTLLDGSEVCTVSKFLGISKNDKGAYDINKLVKMVWG